MNEKDVLKKIKQEAEGQMPNLRSFIVQNFPKNQPFSFFKLLPIATILTGVFIFAIIIQNTNPIAPSSDVILSSNTTSQTSETSLPLSSQVVLPPLRLNNEKEAISISSITSATLLTNLSINNTQPLLNPALQIKLRPLRERETINFEATMTLLTPYLTVFEQFLGTNEAPLINSQVSDDVNFEFLDTFVVYDIEGLAIPYALYYKVESSEVIEEETYYVFSGELVIDTTVRYTVTGSKIQENDETKIIFRANLDDINYIETEYKFEEDETKIKVKKLINNVLTISEFKLEIEDDETVVELKFFENNDSNRTKDTFKFEYETENGETILDIKFDMQGANGRIKGKISVYVIPVLNDQNEIIGYRYQAIQFNEDGEREDGEWEDDRHGPRGDHRDDEDEDEDDHEEDDNEEDED
ncbi:MAG: hypothetical protein FJ352_02140 [Firmicutes bacterium]|nr:hypothetical protein [Bacillota bacterium]